MTNSNQTNTCQCSTKLTVLYDGACLLCRRKIAVYRDLQLLKSVSPIWFANISNTTVPLPTCTQREQLLAQFYVQGRDGQLLSGSQCCSAGLRALTDIRKQSQHSLVK